MSRKEEIIQLRQGGMSYRKIGLKFGISRQRVHQIIAGYLSPASRPIPPHKHKFLTKRKRQYLGISDEEYQRQAGNGPKPPESHRVLSNAKRNFLRLPTGKVAISKGGGRDHRRELVRMRDNHTCQICGKVWKEGQRRFDIHHKDEDSTKTKRIDPVEEFGNLITLCHKCHLGLHYSLVNLQ